MSMFNQNNPPAPGGVDDDSLETNRPAIRRHPVLKWQTVGTYVEFAVVDYNDTAPVKEGGVQKVRRFDDGTEKKVTQDVITGLVIGGTALVSPPEDDNRLDPVTPGLVVTQFVAGHNRWDPNRAQNHGQSWRAAKDVLGRGLVIGDLVRIDYLAFLEVASNGRKLQNGKKVLGFQVRPIGGTPAELEILEQARAARRNIKAAPAAAAPTSGGGFRPAPQTSQAPVVPSAPASSTAAPTRGLFD